jgi:hypothetical protein
MAMSLASNQARALHIFTCLFPASLDAPALLDPFGAVGERFDAAQHVRKQPFLLRMASPDWNASFDFSKECRKDRTDFGKWPSGAVGLYHLS